MRVFKAYCYIILTVCLIVLMYKGVYGSENPYASFAYMDEEDKVALRNTIYYESARCACPIETSEAVVQTVFNRVLSDKFPNSVKDVIYQKGQFSVVPYFKTASVDEWVKETNNEYILEEIDDAISEVINGRTVLPNTKYLFFATKKQSCAKNHIWIGGRNSSGNPKKGKGMWFGERK